MKKGRYYEDHWLDEDGNPSGGVSSGRGFAVAWQNGPLGRGAERREPNGAFVEDVIAAVIGRIEFYEATRFSCEANKRALMHLNGAAAALDSRTQDREARDVEGTYKE